MIRPLPTSEIYDGIESLNLPHDTQGWHSDHPIFSQLIEETKPATIIECGSWKGASIINMAKLAPAANLFACDSFLGGIDHETNQQVETSVFARDRGYPRLYFQFLANVARSGCHERIFPIPQTSINAARFLEAHQIQAELIYIDASHEGYDPYYDMHAYWPLLKLGGIMFGDDSAWPSVAVSYYRFLFELGQGTFKPEIVDKNFWIVRKPL